MVAKLFIGRPPVSQCEIGCPPVGGVLIREDHGDAGNDNQCAGSSNALNVSVSSGCAPGGKNGTKLMSFIQVKKLTKNMRASILELGNNPVGSR
jgi:hypothetical protein